MLMHVFKAPRLFSYEALLRAIARGLLRLLESSDDGHILAAKDVVAGVSGRRTGG